MAINTEDANKMLVEATLGKEQTSLKGEEARRYYAALKAEVDQMLEKGYAPLPHAD